MFEPGSHDPGQHDKRPETGRARARGPPPLETGFVYTANERGNSISVIDLRTGQMHEIATPITPHNVQVSRDGRRLLAVGPVAAMTGNQSQTKMSQPGW